MKWNVKSKLIDTKSWKETVKMKLFTVKSESETVEISYKKGIELRF